ncbi:helix-turn-helix domain-containing protein [Cytobacillus gottheilii]|uniref:helix-turn-helix domain-containing protein n=1 Tax=Cytobacillus gottheilii TaxID=859144 RepID=UPI00082DEED5|nr:helix-turn-helix domain-containing protein [Cytobacillus gottheilii]
MQNIRTIVVDDEARIRRGIERLVKSFGEEWEIVGTYSDGREAYENIINNHIHVDLVITDVKMPEMDGLSFIRELKKSHSFFAFFISGFDDFQYLQSAIREGAVNYILKPIDRKQFRSELDKVKEKIMNKRKEQHELEVVYKKASLVTYTKQVQLLSEMTWMDHTDVSMLNWDNEFPNGKYRLAYISVDQAEAKNKQLQSREYDVWNFAIENIIEETLMHQLQDDQVRRWWWHNGKYNYWLLLNENSKESDFSFSETAYQVLNIVQENINIYTPYTVSIAVGNEFEDIRQLLSNKNKLLSLLQFRIIQGGNHIFRSDLIKNELEKSSKGIPPSIYIRAQQIMHWIEQENNKKADEALQTFFDELDHLSSPSLVEEALHYLFIKITNLWMDKDGYCVEPYILTEAMNMMKYATSFDHLKEETACWIIGMMNKIQSLSNKQPDSIQQVKKWIDEHLGENITVKRIADLVYMNPTYFCEYFKNNTGITVLDYVTQKRLEKAKELLEIPDLKIYDISDAVGYHDTKYFSKLFKKWHGNTPSQYREAFFKRISTMKEII